MDDVTTKQQHMLVGTVRGYRATLRDAHHIMLSRMGMFARSLWPICLLSGVCVTLLIYLLPKATPQTVMWEIGIVGLAELFLLSVMIQVVSAMLADKSEDSAWLPFGYRRDGGKLLKKSLHTFGLFIIQYVLMGLLVVASLYVTKQFPYIWIFAVLLCAFLAVFINVGVFYQVQSGTGILKSCRWSMMRMKNYFGTTFFLLFVAFWEILLSTVVLCLPLIIINLAIFQSNQAVLMGDFTDLPHSIPVVQIVLGIILVSLSSFMQICWIFPQILHVASVRTMTLKRKKVE